MNKDGPCIYDYDDVATKYRPSQAVFVAFVTDWSWFASELVQVVHSSHCKMKQKSQIYSLPEVCSRALNYPICSTLHDGL